MAVLFYICPFTITITYFSFPSKTNKQKPCLLLKYHLFFTLIYCPLATSPLVPGQVIRLPPAALAGEGHGTAAQEACTGPAALQSALYVSTAICPAVSPGAGQVLRDARSLPLRQRLCPLPRRNRVERQGLLRHRLRGSSLCVFESVDKDLTQENNYHITKQNNPLLSQGPSVLNAGIISLLSMGVRAARESVTTDSEGQRTASEQTRKQACGSYVKSAFEHIWWLVLPGWKSALPLTGCLLATLNGLRNSIWAFQEFPPLLQDFWFLPDLSEYGFKITNSLCYKKRIFLRVNFSWHWDKFSERKLL